jgi:glycosyltransferase involved in cell wall biosynthesis
VKILLDLQGAQTVSRQRGIGRYTIALTRGIVRNAGDHEVWVGMTNGLPGTIAPLKEALADVLPEERMLVWNTVTPTGDIFWQNDNRLGQAQVLREAFINSLEPDIIHCSSVIEGSSESSVTTVNRHFDGPPSAATLYDLIPLLDAKRYLGNISVERWYHQRVAELRRADLLLAISESSQREGREILGLPAERLVNIRCAADDIFVPVTLSPERQTEVRERYGISKPYVLYTGGVDPRKNVFGLITAFSMLPAHVREAHQLVLVGSGDPAITPRLVSHVGREGLRDDQVVFTGFVPDDDMVALYNLSAAFAFPSDHEGFGLPPLEAMSCGIPTIAADTSSLPEVLGNPDALFAPHNTPDMAAKLERVLTDNSYRDELARRGLEQAKTFSWDHSAKRALAAFEEVVARSRPRRHGDPGRPHRPRLAFVSPLPSRGGSLRQQLLHIVEEFDRYYDVHLITNHTGQPWDFEGPARLVTPAQFDETSGDFDRIVHHLANEPEFGFVRDILARHPGTLLLDDYYLDRALACSSAEMDPPQAWMESVIEAHGYDTLHRFQHARATGNTGPRVALNEHVLTAANGVMVTDERTLEIAREHFGDDFVSDWVCVPMLYPGRLVDSSKHASRPAVAVFGQGTRQLIHRIIVAWLDSRIASDPKAELLLVGQSEDTPFGKVLTETLTAAAPSARWRLVPFDEADEVVDRIRFGVQLSTGPQAEESRWALACRSLGITVITDLEAGTDPTQTALVAMLDEAWDREAQGQRTHEVPPRIEEYRDAIEHLHTHGKLALQAEILHVAGRQPMPDGDQWARTVTAVQRNHPFPSRQPTLLVDLSSLVRVDPRTGVQRVARSIARELLIAPPDGFRVEPVYCDDEGDLRYARTYAAKLLGYDAPQLRSDRVVARRGDVFLGLDLNDRTFPVQMPATVVAEPLEPMLEQLRSIGVSCQFVVYDLIASRHPEWFPPGLSWFDDYVRGLVRRGDGLICISESTARDIEAWIRDNEPTRVDMPVSWFHLGADIENSAPTEDVAPDFEKRWAQRGTGQSVLMVGTLEPRKGHDQVLAAFTELWRAGVEANLVLVGRAGWGVKRLVQDLRQHPEWGKRLLWFEAATDVELMRLYQASDGCLMASRGEGFGLPLIEAARYDIPVLARDLPVFREVGGDHVTYFSGDRTHDLATSLTGWFRALKDGSAPRSGQIDWLTWEGSSRQFVAALRHNLGI